MKSLLVILLTLVPLIAWACPNCINAVDEGKPQYTLIIIGIFILLTYIPFYILFSAAKKYDPSNGNK